MFQKEVRNERLYINNSFISIRDRHSSLKKIKQTQNYQEEKNGIVHHNRYFLITVRKRMI